MLLLLFVLRRYFIMNLIVMSVSIRFGHSMNEVERYYLFNVLIHKTDLTAFNFIQKDTYTNWRQKTIIFLNLLIWKSRIAFVICHFCLSTSIHTILSCDMNDFFFFFCTLLLLFCIEIMMIQEYRKVKCKFIVRRW